MKNFIFLGVTVLAVIWFAGKVREWEREDAAMQELDNMLAEILGDCMEAFCEDCDRLIAQGTGARKETVATVAYNHGEVYDHDVVLRTWAE